MIKPGNKEIVIKSEIVFIKEASGEMLSAMLALSDSHLVVVYYDDSENENAFKIFPLEYINTVNGIAQIVSGGGNQPFFEINFPDESLYITFGHSIRRAWQIQIEERVKQWISAINAAIRRYISNNSDYSMLYSAARSQYYDNRNYMDNIQQTKKPNFCPGCGNPLSQEDVFCVACGRRV